MEDFEKVKPLIENIQQRVKNYSWAVPTFNLLLQSRLFSSDWVARKNAFCLARQHALPLTVNPFAQKAH